MTITSSRLTALGIGFGAIALIAIFWFASFPNGVVMDDDLRLIYDTQHGGYGSDGLASYFNIADPLPIVVTVIALGLFAVVNV